MLKEINEKYVELVNEPLDPTLIRTNYSGEKYITGYTVVRLLNKLTNGAWDFTIDKTWVEKCTDKKGEHDIYHMDVTLSCYFDDGHGNKIKISKPGTAGKVLEAGAKNASNIYKSLETLALRKAASYFGIGAELWLNGDEIDYFEQESKEIIWTDDLLAEYTETWQEISDIQEKCELSDEDMNGVVQAWNSKYSELGDIVPEDINKFLDFMHAQLDIREGIA
jgi:hypothetical protein